MTKLVFDEATLKALELMIKNCNKELLKEIGDLKNQMKFYSDSFEEFKNEIKDLKNENKNNKREVDLLKVKNSSL